MISHLTRELVDALFNVENAGGRVNILKCGLQPLSYFPLPFC